VNPRARKNTALADDVHTSTRCPDCGTEASGHMFLMVLLVSNISRLTSKRSQIERCGMCHRVGRSVIEG
jgi:hypothetical protein